MAKISPADSKFLRTISRLAYCNPFLHDRIDLEREALGERFSGSAEARSRTDSYEGINPNSAALVLRTETTISTLRQQLADSQTASERGKSAALRLSPDDWAAYEDAVLFFLYHRYQLRFAEAIVAMTEGNPREHRFRFWGEFLREFEHYLLLPAIERTSDPPDPAHLFACFFQLRRAFHFIFEFIIGASKPAARLRGAVWESIFTHDMPRYRRALFSRMGDFPTLIIGPSGTGKELVARAVAFARYIPFDPKTQSFRENFSTGFFPLNLSALSPTLIESELFGHRRGSFTGALEDRVGWLEVCPETGTVFLDEVGDVEAPIQVKLLRVLQSRRFQRIGDRDERLFRGKLVAATNRDLASAIARGEFREDFYFRLRADVIETPSLREQLDDSPEALAGMIGFFARRIAGPEEAERVAAEVGKVVQKQLGASYPWPGNVRELEQCVRAVIVHGIYSPPAAPASDRGDHFTERMLSGALSAEELLSEYCQLVYAQTGSYQETARRLGLDYRTVKARVNERSR